MQPQDTIGYWLSYALRYVGSAFFEVLEAHCMERGKAYVITPAQWGVMALLSANGEQTIGMLAQLVNDVKSRSSTLLVKDEFPGLLIKAATQIAKTIRRGE